MGSVVQTEQWKELVTCLPGVLGAAFILDSGTIREVHILSDQSRGPKQIVRDVQSAMLTRFQVELDHRLISVAQIPATALEAKRRLICERLELKTGRDSSVVTVHLTLDGVQFVGSATCDLSATGRFRAIVLATVEALNQLLASGCRLSVDDVRRCAMGDRQAVLVGLSLKLSGKNEALLGACYEGEDPNFSAALATLDAVNRRLPTLPRTQSRDEQSA